MLFLIDENLPLSITSYLQSLNHDVLDVAGSDLRGSSDKFLWNKAANENRILVTRDLDYPLRGTKANPFAVILIRVPSEYTASLITQLFKEAFAGIDAQKIKDKVAVITPGRIRISPLPK